ncbi:MAG: non-ribosomal peptide synthetase, partial [Marinosulfonomonas sp.]|nr:non-ribosomal peptide synthetase [Marinosulfonomonas sp.]
LLASSAASDVYKRQVPLNSRYEKAEFVDYLARTRVDLLLVGAGIGEAAILAARELGIPIHPLDGGDFAPDRLKATQRFDKPGPDDLAIVLLTSGTTGQSKIVPLTHQNLWTGASDVARSLGLGPDDCVLSMWEQAHIGGISDLLLAPLISGGSIFAAGGFNANRFFEFLPAVKPTWFQGVPTTVRELHRHAIRRQIPCQNTSLRFLRSVAAALPADWMKDLEKLFDVPVIQTFGMTEASPLITSTRLAPHQRKPNSVGSSCGTELAILDTGSGIIAKGKVGEVAIKGANVFTGYEGDESANSASFRNGWFITGDRGYLDEDGDLFLTGRTKDMINRGGEKISPAEVEAAVLYHPSIEQAATFAVPHPTLGENVGVAVVLGRGCTLTANELRVFVSKTLAKFKVPAHVMFLDDLPKSRIGKVLRNEILEEFLARARVKPASVEPANELENLLAELWAEELDLPTVGIDDNFFDLGGDSLSSTRIILASEVALGIQIPANSGIEYDTVRAMAARLASILKATKSKRSAQKKRIKKGKILTGVSRTMLGESPLPDNILYDCARELDFEIARHTAENLSTPKEIETLLRGRRSTQAANWYSNPMGALRIARNRRLMRADFRRAISGSVAPLSWTRKKVVENADIYSTTGVAKENKALIVGFTSRAMRLTTPTFHILCALDPTRFDLLLLRDPTRRHYMDGVPGFGGSVESAALQIAQYAAAHQYPRVMALGTSSGAIPAICTAIINRWPRVLACGADRISSHPHLQQIMNKCAGLMDVSCPTSVKLAYSGRNPRDTAGAGELKKILHKACVLPDDRFKEHPLLYKLQMQGELAAFLTNNLTG